MKTKILLLFFFSIVFLNARGQCYVGAEISYRNISGLEYEVTITTYTRTSCPADRPSLDSVSWGDGTISPFVRITKTSIPNDISINVYKNSHTYPGNGTYKTYVGGVFNSWAYTITNLANSNIKPIKYNDVLIISPSFAANNSAVLNNMPVFHAPCCNQLIYNDSAFDIDGDSLSYALLSYDSTYSFAGATIDSTGDFHFTPSQTGFFLFTIETTEWRKIGLTPHAVGSTMRTWLLSIDSTTLVKEINEEAVSNIYPNPLISSSTLHFNTQLNNAELIIYNVLGKEMLQKNFSGNEVQIEKGKMESGVYFVKVGVGEKEWVEKLMVE